MKYLINCLNNLSIKNTTYHHKASLSELASFFLIRGEKNPTTPQIRKWDLNICNYKYKCLIVYYNQGQKQL